MARIDNLIFDSDILGDDLFALHAIVRNPDIRLVGVTTFGRRVSAMERAYMTQVFLDDYDAAGIEITAGADAPLIQSPRPGCIYCDEQIKSLRERWNNKKIYSNPILDENASVYIIRKSLELGKISLLCTGPLTNIAIASMLDSSLPSRVERIFIMGGVHSISGNSSPKAEANIFNDPEAASIVFSKFKGIHVIPYDLTIQIAIDISKVKYLPTAFFKETAASCCHAHKCKGEEEIMPLHDWLAYVAMVDESAVDYKTCSISIEISESQCRGMMVLRNDSKGSAFLGVSLNKKIILSHFFEDFGVML